MRLLGRWLYLGNIYQDVSQYVFFHAKPAKGEADANEADAAKGRLESGWDYSTVGYARNVFHEITGDFGLFESTGQVYATLPEMSAALREREALKASIGQTTESSLLRDPENGDMRPQAGAETAGGAVKFFVPWALYATVGEWHFFQSHEDPTTVTDYHWYMQAPYPERQYYIKMPRYPLKVDWASAADYVEGALEDWVPGALKFRGQPAVLSTEALNQGASFENKEDGPVEVSPSAFKTADMGANSFLIEMAFRAEKSGAASLVEKMGDDTGYRLALDAEGRPSLTIRGAGQSVQAVADTGVEPAQAWVHVVAEVDRQNGALRIYVDGKLAVEESLRDLSAETALSNQAPLQVGDGFHGAVDFLRISRGTLEDARTSIEELYTWQFQGPHLLDFAGRQRTFGQGPSGALEK